MSIRTRPRFVVSPTAPRWFVTSLLVSLATSLVTLAEVVPNRPRLHVEPEIEHFAIGSAAVQGRPGVGGFFEEHTDLWRVLWDQRGDRPHMIEGVGVPLVPGSGNELTPTDLGLEPAAEIEPSMLVARARTLLDTHDALFRLAGDGIELDAGSSHRFGRDERIAVVTFGQVHHDLPVLGARAVIRTVHGNAVQIGLVRLAPVDPALDLEPSLSSEIATLVVRDDLLVDEDAPTEGAELMLVPMAGEGDEPEATFSHEQGYGHRLVWHVLLGGDDGGHEAWVDAHSGELLVHRSRRRAGEAHGAVRSAAGDGALEVHPMAWLHVGRVPLEVTGVDGTFGHPNPSNVELDGRSARVIDAQCGAVDLSVDSAGDLDFAGVGVCATDCDGVPRGSSGAAIGGEGNTHAGRSAYVHVTRAETMAADHNLYGHRVNISVNRTQTECNAFWDGSTHTIQLFQSGDSCVNTGEVAGLVLHEWGHARDDHGGGFPPDAATAEAAADLATFLVTDDTCIGRGLRPGTSCRDCRPECSGVRDLEPLTYGGSATIAHPSHIADGTALACMAGTPDVGPMGYVSHCEGKIASTAVIDAERFLSRPLGATDARAQSWDLWGMILNSPESAYRYTGHPYTHSDGRPNPGVDGCMFDSWYTLARVVDDDDGDLSNGTLNTCAVFRAFDLHGIACGTESCVPTIDAGPDREICAGDSIEIGPEKPVDQGLVVDWLPGGPKTPRIMVTPSSTTTYTMRTRDPAKPQAERSRDTVEVVVHPCGSWSEGFETQPIDWRFSGAWHWEDDPSSPVLPVGSTRSMRFGQPDIPSYDTCTVSRGELVSPPIDGIVSDTALWFSISVEVEPNLDGWDRIELAVAELESDAWEVRWAADSTDLPIAGWHRVGPISLAAYENQAVRLRWLFDSFDPKANHYRGIALDDVHIAAVSSTANPDPPHLNIGLLDIDDSVNDSCDVHWLKAQATGEGEVMPGSYDLGAMVAWSSNLDGPLGYGDPLPVVLSSGLQQLTARVVDLDGDLASQSLSVHIPSGQSPCDPTLGWPPADVRLVYGRSRSLSGPPPK